MNTMNNRCQIWVYHVQMSIAAGSNKTRRIVAADVPQNEKLLVESLYIHNSLLAR